MNARGLVYKTGNRESIAPLMPFLLMDIAYDLWKKKVTPLPLKFEAKQLANAFINDYTSFNKPFFAAFDDDQRDWVIDRMDELGAYLEHDIFITQISLMNLFNDRPIEEQDVVASILLCGAITQMAQIIYGAVFRTRKGNDEPCPELANMRRYTRRLSALLYHSNKVVKPNADEQATAAVTVIVNKTKMWFKNRDKDDRK